MTDSTTGRASIPSLLAQARGKRNMRTMAEELDVSEPTYSRWERGLVALRFNLLPWLAERTGVPLDELENLWQLEQGDRALRKVVSEGQGTEPMLGAVLERLAHVEEMLTTLLAAQPTQKAPRSNVHKREA